MKISSSAIMALTVLESCGMAVQVKGTAKTAIEETEFPILWEAINKALGDFVQKVKAGTITTKEDVKVIIDNDDPISEFYKLCSESSGDPSKGTAVTVNDSLMNFIRAYVTAVANNETMGISYNVNVSGGTPEKIKDVDDMLRQLGWENPTNWKGVNNNEYRNAYMAYHLLTLGLPCALVTYSLNNAKYQGKYNPEVNDQPRRVQVLLYPTNENAKRGSINCEPHENVSGNLQRQFLEPASNVTITPEEFVANFKRNPMKWLRGTDKSDPPESQHYASRLTQPISLKDSSLGYDSIGVTPIMHSQTWDGKPGTFRLMPVDGSTEGLGQFVYTESGFTDTCYHPFKVLYLGYIFNWLTLSSYNLKKGKYGVPCAVTGTKRWDRPEYLSNIVTGLSEPEDRPPDYPIVGKADWIVSVRPLSINGLIGDTATVTLTPEPALLDIIKAGNLGCISNGSTKGLTTSVTAEQAARIAEAIASGRPLAEVLEEIIQVVLTNTETGTIITDPETTIPDYIEQNPGGPSILPDIPSLGSAATNIISIYNPTAGEMTELASKLWSKDFSDNISKIFNNPMDGLISFHMLPFKPKLEGVRSCKIGNWDSKIQMAYVRDQFFSLNLGSVYIKPLYNNFLDYHPYTTAQVWLPFIGFHQLDINEIMGTNITIQYNFDVVSGVCTANIVSGKTGVVMYSFTGNCAMSIPLSATNYSEFYSSIASGIMGTAGAALSGGASAGISAGISGAMSSFLAHEHTTERSGSISGNGGFLSNTIPYVLLTRPKSTQNANFGLTSGYTSNLYASLGSLSGFTVIDDINLSCSGTEAEKDEIISLLKGGVIL